MREGLHVAERWIIDAAGTAPLVLPHKAVRSAVTVIGVETPPPAPRTAFAQRPEGALPVNREHELRDVKLTLAVVPVRDEWAGTTHDFGAPAPEAEGEGSPAGWAGTVRRASGGSEQVAAIEDLQQVLGGFGTSAQSVSGTLTRVWPDGRRATLDVVEVLDDGIRQDRSWYAGRHTQITITLRCLPYWRGTERLIGSGSRTAGQRLVTIDDLDVPGDVAALARIELSGATVDQRSVLYAIDQGTAPVEYACSDLDRPVSATLQTVAGSVSLQVVQRAAFTSSVGIGLWEPGVLLSQSGGPLEQPGRWRVMARVRAQSGGRVRLRWTSGSRAAGMSIERPVTLRSDSWELITLGVVSIGSDGLLDGVIEAALPHDQPVQYDRLLFVPVRQGEQHATLSTPPSEVLAADEFDGTAGTLGGLAPTVGGAWGAVGAGAEASRDPGPRRATRTAVYSTSGRSHGLALGSPTGVRTSATIAIRPDLPHGDPSGCVGIWVANALGETAIAGYSGATGKSGSGVAGAWGVYLALRALPATGQVRWALTLIHGTAVTTVTSDRVFSVQPSAVTLTVSGTTARATVFDRGLRMDQAISVPAVPGTLRSGIASHGWTRSGVSAAAVDWSRFAALLVPAAQDAALFAGRSARHASGDSSRVDAAGIRGPVVPIGARPRLPSAGRGGARTRVVVATARGDLREQIDEAPTDPLDVDVYATPRWLQIPGVGA